jgi:hypothetical protein
MGCQMRRYELCFVVLQAHVRHVLTILLAFYKCV